MLSHKQPTFWCYGFYKNSACYIQYMYRVKVFLHYITFSFALTSYLVKVILELSIITITYNNNFFNCFKNMICSIMFNIEVLFTKMYIITLSNLFRSLYCNTNRVSFFLQINNWIITSISPLISRRYNYILIAFFLLLFGDNNKDIPQYNTCLAVVYMILIIKMHMYLYAIKHASIHLYNYISCDVVVFLIPL